MVVEKWDILGLAPTVKIEDYPTPTVKSIISVILAAELFSNEAKQKSPVMPFTGLFLKILSDAGEKIQF